MRRRNRLLQTIGLIGHHYIWHWIILSMRLRWKRRRRRRRRMMHHKLVSHHSSWKRGGNRLRRRRRDKHSWRSYWTLKSLRWRRRKRRRRSWLKRRWHMERRRLHLIHSAWIIINYLICIHYLGDESTFKVRSISRN